MKRPALIIACGLILLALIGAGLWYSLFSDLPSPEDLSDRLQTPSIRITDRNGQLLYEVLPETGGRHLPLAPEQIPSCLAQATVATEDANFYQHPGVDVTGILRAFWINLQGGETLAGGSTITQQVARSLLLSPEERYQTSLRRKLRESYLAWRLTRRYSKEEILALYLNQSYYGSLAYGIEAAAQTYFAKPAAELDLAECALIAGLPQAPALYSPFSDPQAAERRQAVVLRRLYEQELISAEQRQAAEREPLFFAAQPYPMEAPHFSLMILAKLDGLLPPQERPNSGLTVRTTLDLNWQRLAEAAVTSQLERLRQQPDGVDHNVNSAALIALNAHNGEIWAMVGSPDYFDDQHAGALNMALAARQPGSALKPLLYAAGMQPALSQPWTAATGFLDVPSSFLTSQGESYTPENYDLRYHGPVLLREALASSLNIPAVQALDQLGLPAFFSFAARLGLDDFGNPQDYDLSLALGGGEVSLLDLTSAYATFASGGLRLPPVSVLEITDGQGNIVYAQSADVSNRVLDAGVAWLISDILSDNNARILGFGPNSVLRLDLPAAVKTGTTSNFHDNWTIGYTPDWVVGVWAGNPDYAPMRQVSGVTGAGPIWHTFLRSALSGQPQQYFTRPDGLIQLEICAESGLLATPACPQRRLEWFLAGSEPSASDTMHHLIELDLESGQLANTNTPSERRGGRLAYNLPPAAQPWARSQGWLLLADLQSATNTSGGTAAAPLLLLSPADQAIFRIDPAYPEDMQQIPIEAAGAGFSELTLWVDGQVLARFSGPPYRTWWRLEIGAHTFWAVGRTSSAEEITSPRITITVNQP